MSKKLSNCIKELRIKKGLTQKELAGILGIGQTTVANYEQGIRVPDTDKLNKIADFFEVSLDYLLRRKENKTSDEEDTKSVSLKGKAIDEAYKIYMDFLLQCQSEEARKCIRSMHQQGIKIEDIYTDILGKAQKEVGTLWEKGSIDIWKEHVISEVTLDIMRELKVKEKKTIKKGNSILALTPGPELHNIGLRMITDMLEIQGWHVIYLGSNVPAQSLIKAIEFEKPMAVAISVTMEYHIESAKFMISAIRNNFEKKAPKIIIGGSAFKNCDNVCEETGADYYGKDIEEMKNIMKSV